MNGFEIREGLVGDYGNNRDMKVIDVRENEVVLQNNLGCVIYITKNKFYKHFTIRDIHVWMYNDVLRFIGEFERQVENGNLMTVEELKEWCRG